MVRHSRLLAAVAAGTLTLSVALVAAPSGATGRHHAGHHAGHHPPSLALKPVLALDGPRGVDALGRGRTLVGESDGSFSLVVERRHRAALRLPLGAVAPGFAPAVAAGPHGTVYVLTGGGEPGTGAATLYRWQRGDDAPTPMADIAAYQATDPDPDDLEDFPEDSNPFGLAVERDGHVLVADAAGNDVLRVDPDDGSIVTVARLRPRTVEVPDGLPPTDPDGNPLPPAGTPIPSEAVATSVAVGRHGTIYVGELRGFPATPGTSQVWRIAPGAEDAVCDPEAPDTGDCTLAQDGLTSIVDLAVGKRDRVYALSLSTLSWLALELGVEGAEIGSLTTWARHGRWATELVPGRLTSPGGVDVARGGIYVTGPVFGPGSLSKIVVKKHRHHVRPHRR